MSESRPNLAGGVLAGLAILVVVVVPVTFFIAFLGGMEGFAAADGGRPSDASGYFAASALVGIAGLALALAVGSRISRGRTTRD